MVIGMWTNSVVFKHTVRGISLQKVRVSIDHVMVEDLPVEFTGLGNVSPLTKVNLVSQTSGYLVDVAFKEGEFVHKGQYLAQIDPRPFQVQLAQYEGQLKRDQAQLENARLDLTRFRQLIKNDSVSQQNVDTQSSKVKQLEGTVDSDQALVDQQKLNINYCRLTSPIDGIMGLRAVDVGNYVTAASTELAVIAQTHPISVIFSISEDVLSKVSKAKSRGTFRLSALVYDRTDSNLLKRSDQVIMDNIVDSSTGTIRFRAILDNQDRTLYTNQFVTVHLVVETIPRALTINYDTILYDKVGSFVFVYTPDGHVKKTRITMGAVYKNRAEILTGLKPEDYIVVEGVNQIRSGDPVDAVKHNTEESETHEGI